MLQFNVSPYRFRCHLIPNRSHKVPVVPQLPSPQLFSQSRISSKYLPRRDTLEYLYHLARTVPRRTRHKDVYMVFHHFHRVDLQFVSLRDSLEYFFQFLSHFSSDNHFPVLGNPYKMVLQIVNRMLCTLHYAHACNRISAIRLQRISVFLPPASWGYPTEVLYEGQQPQETPSRQRIAGSYCLGKAEIARNVTD